MDRDDPAYRGQAMYTPLALRLYDPFVLGPIARFGWRCPTSLLLERYRRHIRPGHLDIGPGTGYFLDRSGLPDASPVTIVDPNPDVLRHATRRLARLSVTAVEADVLHPLPVDGPFRSAAMHLVLHVLPGPLERKRVAIGNVAARLDPDGVLFGATVLGDTADHSWLARRMIAFYARRGAFDNLEDSESSVRELLLASFQEVELDVVGSMALFSARGPRPPAVDGAAAGDGAPAVADAGPAGSPSTGAPTLPA